MRSRVVAAAVAAVALVSGALLTVTSGGATTTLRARACIGVGGSLGPIVYGTTIPSCPPGEAVAQWAVTISSTASTTTTTVKATTTTSTAVTTTTTTVPPTTTTTTIPAPGLNPDRPFSASSPWNTPTPTGTAWFDTPSLHVDGSGATRHWWMNADTDVYYAGPGDPVWTFNMPAFVAPQWNRNRPAQSFQMRAPQSITPGGNSDGQLVVVEPDGSYVEVWVAAVDATNHIVTSNGPGWATGNAITGTGVGGLVADGGNNAGTRAANFSYQAGRISLDEITGSTPIDHALVLVLTNDMLKGGWPDPSPSGNYVAPATADDSAVHAGLIKAGSRIGIPAGTPQPAGLSPLGVKVFNALRTYGAFVGDYAGGNLPILQMDGTDNSVACTLFCFWNNYHGQGISDMELIGPLLRVADYQP